MFTSKLSREFSAGEEKRLREGWADPEVTIVTLRARFRLSYDDVEKLRLELGPKARPSAACRVDGGKPHRLLGNGWSSAAKERERHALARTIRRAP